MIVTDVASHDDRLPSDAELLAALADGDLTALGTLYARHGSLAYGVALRMTGDRRRAEDVVHVAFMDLWTDRAEPPGGTDPVRLRLVRLVARAAMVDIRRHPPKGRARSDEQRAGLVIRKPTPVLSQGT